MSRFSRGHTAASKLTAMQVLEIRERYNEGWTQGRLAREYNISVVQIGRIVRGESWQRFYQPVSSDVISESEAAFRASLDVPLKEITDNEPSIELPDGIKKANDTLGLNIDDPLSHVLNRTKRNESREATGPSEAKSKDAQVASSGSAGVSVAQESTDDQGEKGFPRGGDGTDAKSSGE